jgi:hypothetical protein
MREEHWITPERRENARNALAILSLQFSGGDGDLAEFLGDLASEHPTEPFEDFVLRLVEGVLDLVQFLTLMRYDEMAKPPSETLAELGRMFAEPVEPDGSVNMTVRFVLPNAHSGYGCCRSSPGGG